MALIHIRDNLAKSALFDLFGRGVRLVAAAVLAVALLTPLLQGFFLALGTDGSSCGMSCCKTARTCHHRPGHHNPEGSQWTSGTQCPKGCGQSAGLPETPGFSLTAGGFVAGPVRSESVLSCQSRVVPGRAGIEFALFQRPPPFLS